MARRRLEFGTGETGAILLVRLRKSAQRNKKIEGESSRRNKSMRDQTGLALRVCRRSPNSQTDSR
jgi:hypothetical protein